MLQIIIPHNNMSKIMIPLSTNTSNKKCSLKCNFFYSYNNSPSLTVYRVPNSNSAQYLNVTEGIGSALSGNVTYNSIQYEVTNIYLYRGAIHDFSGSEYPADMEIVIKHTATSRSSNLYVCIPVFKTTGASTETSSYNLIDRLIRSYDDIYPESSLITISDFNINQIIPRSTYFVHTGIYREDEDGTNDVYIVFPSNSMYLSESTMNIFTKICTNSYIPTFNTNAYIFQNVKGTTLNGFSPGDGQIYIDCQPTDSEGEITFAEQKVSKKLNINPDTLLILFISFVFIIIVGFGFKFLYSRFLAFRTTRRIDPDPA